MGAAACGERHGGRPLILIRPLEARDLAAAAAIEATAPDAWSENALRTSLQARQEGGAARLFAAERAAGCAAECAAERAAGCAAASAAGKGGERHGACPPVSLAGIAAFQLAGDSASLDTLTVAPAFRRQGVGRALLQAALQSLRAEGAAACFLEVRQSNAPAIALYQGLGFAAVGRRRGFYQGPAEDAVVMRCALYQDK